MNQAVNGIAKRSQINIRPDAKLYRAIKQRAKESGKSVNFFLCDYLEILKNGSETLHNR